MLVPHSSPIISTLLYWCSIMAWHSGAVCVPQHLYRGTYCIYLRHTKSLSLSLIHLEVVEAISEGNLAKKTRLQPTNYSTVNAVHSYEGRKIQMCRLSPSNFALINSHNVGSRPLFRLCRRHDSWISAYQKWSPTRIQTHSHVHTCHTL